MTRYTDPDWPKPPYTEAEARSVSIRRKLDRINGRLLAIALQLILLNAIAFTAALMLVSQ